MGQGCLRSKPKVAKNARKKPEGIDLWGEHGVSLTSLMTPCVAYEAGLDTLKDIQKAQTSDNSRLNEVEAMMVLAQDDMAAVDAMIRARMVSEVPVIPALADHLIAAGGKRLRPLLCVAAARLCQTNNGHHHRLATAVEFIHTATLLHDDVVDSSRLRRGKVAAHLIWGAPSSVLVGDFLFARAFELMVETHSLKALGILSHAAAVITEGEVLQLTKAFDPGLTQEDYIRIISAKTAALFAASSQSGAVTAGADEAATEALYQFGLNLGLAFQIRDDVLDYGGDSADLGKNAGDDFAEGKATLPLILAVHQTGEAHREFWERVISRRDQTPEDFAQAKGLMINSGALDAASDVAQLYAEKARAYLEDFAPSPWRTGLEALSA